ncbi:Vacuolar protein sorting-associated protein 5 [Pleurotus pulmonarius]|nr:Vacuolar protein sorting-associated protein 5 [Pleurotus pulmonarius]
MSTSRLEVALQRMSQESSQHEYDIKRLESQLAENLSNFRAINGLLQDAFGSIQRTTKRADTALNTQIPHISEELDESLEALAELAEALPTIRTQVADIRRVYTSGRQKAQSLVDDLTWLNTEFYERWRTIIFTPNSPVSLRWKALMRLVFTISFLMCTWLAWIALSGAYRAHRQRLYNLMDGFDDLLAPSRSVLEENPFEDPFGKRSNSPDPWATPFLNSVHGGAHDDPYAGFGASSSASTSAAPGPSAYDEHDEDRRTVEEQAKEENITSPVAHEPPLAVAPATSADPLESSRTKDDDADDDDDASLHAPSTSATQTRSPGFRESVPAFSETATIRPPQEDRFPSSSFSRSPPSSANIITSAFTSSDIHGDGADANANAVSPIPPTPTSPRTESLIGSHAQPSPVVSNTHSAGADWGSPFSQASKPGLAFEQSFAGLGLGAESSGWQENATTATATTSAKEGVSEDDSDDDTPIGQTFGKLVAQAEKRQSLQRNDAGLQPVFVISVDDPQKVGDPIRGYTMYTVHTRTTSPMFQKSAFSVLRRYSDFLWLYETLSANNPGVVVPPVPDKNPFGRFDDQFVKQRRFALEKCIQKIANHPLLGKDADLKIFLESDTFALDIKHRKAELAHERGGIMASIGQAVAGPRFYETDEWFDRQKVYLDSLESQLKGLAKAIDAVAKQRSELAAATGEFSQSVGDLSASDIGKGLSHSLSGLADVERMAQEIQSTQSEQDLTTIMGTVDEYARLINSVRMAFSSRIRIYHAWKQSESDLLRIKQSHEKNRAQGRIPTDRLSYSLSQIAEAEKRAAESKHEFEHVSKLVKSELARFEQERVSDFKDSLHAFLEGMIERQKQLINAWEGYQQMLLKRDNGRHPVNGREAPTPA